MNTFVVCRQRLFDELEEQITNYVSDSLGMSVRLQGSAAAAAALMRLSHVPSSISRPSDDPLYDFRYVLRTYV